MHLKLEKNLNLKKKNTVNLFYKKIEFISDVNLNWLNWNSIIFSLIIIIPEVRPITQYTTFTKIRSISIVKISRHVSAYSVNWMLPPHFLINQFVEPFNLISPSPPPPPPLSLCYELFDLIFFPCCVHFVCLTCPFLRTKEKQTTLLSLKQLSRPFWK